MSAARAGQAARFIQVAPWWRAPLAAVAAAHARAGWKVQPADDPFRFALFLLAPDDCAARRPEGDPRRAWKRLAGTTHDRLAPDALRALTGAAWVPTVAATVARVQFAVPISSPHAPLAAVEETTADAETVRRALWRRPDLLRASMGLPAREWTDLAATATAVSHVPTVEETAKELVRAARARGVGADTLYHPIWALDL